MKGIANKDCNKSLLIAVEVVVEDIILVVDDVRVELRETVAAASTESVSVNARVFVRES